MGSNSEQNIKVIKDWLEVHNRDDIEGELAFWDDNAEMTITPTGKVYNGIDELRAAAQMAAKSQGRKTLSHIFASDEWVCAEYIAKSYVAGPMDAHNIKIPAGVTKELTLQICFLANVVDGKIVHAREYWDTGSMLRQLSD
ncbi:MAG TPA: ester cyclase [Candidatus Saccharimonadia bacterium]|nr:ester cyclase [Candidatus Saccharimonadia bacterium]